MNNQDRVSLSQALWRGFLCKCPNCGKGHMFGKFLKVADNCDVCGEEFSHHRADDFPRHSAPIITGGKSGNGTSRTFAGVFARGTNTESPMPKPLAT